MNFSEFIKDYSAHILGFLALIQVWLIAFWNKWIVKGRVEFYPSANIEIGYSAFGSTIGLPGTLRALDKESFLINMTLKSKRNEDSKTHELIWRAFRSSTFSPKTMQPEYLEMATSFTLHSSTPKPIHVFFSSSQFASEYISKAEKLKREWSNYCLQNASKLMKEYTSILEKTLVSETMFLKFAKDSITLKRILEKVNEEFYWKSGNYVIDLNINCAPPVGTIKYSWYFDITDDDEDKLRKNIFLLLKEICGIQVQYNFIYKKFTTKKFN